MRSNFYSDATCLPATTSPNIMSSAVAGKKRKECDDDAFSNCSGENESYSSDSNDCSRSSGSDDLTTGREEKVAELPIEYFLQTDWDLLWRDKRRSQSIYALAQEALRGWGGVDWDIGADPGIADAASETEKNGEKDDDDDVQEKQQRAQPCPPAMLQNIVSTSLVRGYPMPINIQQLSMYLPCSSYNRRKFAAITIRMENPRCTALLFTSGKLVITGTKSYYECLHASLCMSRIVTKTIYNSSYHICTCQIQNIVGNSAIPLGPNQILDIQQMYETHNIKCTYQKTQFPGLIYRCSEYPTVLLCFYSGRVVLTGGKTVRDIEVGWKHLWEVIREFVR